MKKFRTLFFVLLLAGCASSGEKDKLSQADFASQKKTAEEFEKANVLMDAEDYPAAIAIFDRLVVDGPVSTLDAMITFNSGLSHMFLNQCAKAEDRFRKTLRVTNAETPSLAIRARLRLTDALTCLGKEKEAMVMLLEINKNKNLLPLEVAEAEIPAKIAAAYSRNGNQRMAENFFSVAERGLRLVQTKTTPAKEKRTLLAKTLFLMGDTSHVQKSRPQAEPYFKTLKVQQKYLLRAAELDVKPWSPKAIEQLEKAYEPTWEFINQVSSSANPGKGNLDTQTRRTVKQQRSTIVELALETLRQLKESRTIMEQPVPSVAELFRTIEKQETRLNNLLVAEVPGTELTSEALRNLEPKKPGRVKSDETILEKNARKKK